MSLHLNIKAIAYDLFRFNPNPNPNSRIPPEKSNILFGEEIVGTILDVYQYRSYYLYMMRCVDNENY